MSSSQDIALDRPDLPHHKADVNQIAADAIRPRGARDPVFQVTPSLQSILDAFQKHGNGDQHMLQALLAAKKAEDEVSCCATGPHYLPLSFLQRLTALSQAFVSRAHRIGDAPAKRPRIEQGPDERARPLHQSPKRGIVPQRAPLSFAERRYGVHHAQARGRDGQPVEFRMLAPPSRNNDIARSRSMTMPVHANVPLLRPHQLPSDPRLHADNQHLLLQQQHLRTIKLAPHRRSSSMPPVPSPAPVGNRQNLFEADGDKPATVHEESSFSHTGAHKRRASEAFGSHSDGQCKTKFASASSQEVQDKQQRRQPDFRSSAAVFKLQVNDAGQSDAEEAVSRSSVSRAEVRRQAEVGDNLKGAVATGGIQQSIKSEEQGFGLLLNAVDHSRDAFQA